MSEIANKLFYGLLVELISLIVVYKTKDRPRQAITIFFLGTALAGLVAFVLPLTPMPIIPPSSSTLTPSKVVLFADDFENGPINWKVGQNWEIRSDNSGNHFFCVKTTSSDYSYTESGSQSWKDYSLDVKVMVIKSIDAGSTNVAVRANSGPQYSDYVYDFSEKWAALAKESGPPYTRKDLAGMNSRPAVGKWQAVYFAAKGTHLLVALDSQVVLQGEDNSIRLYSK